MSDQSRFWSDIMSVSPFWVIICSDHRYVMNGIITHRLPAHFQIVNTNTLVGTVAGILWQSRKTTKLCFAQCANGNMLTNYQRFRPYWILTPGQGASYEQLWTVITYWIQISVLHTPFVIMYMLMCMYCNDINSVLTYLPTHPLPPQHICTLSLLHVYRHPTK